MSLGFIVVALFSAKTSPSSVSCACGDELCLRLAVSPEKIMQKKPVSKESALWNRLTLDVYFGIHAFIATIAILHWFGGKVAHFFPQLNDFLLTVGVLCIYLLIVVPNLRNSPGDSHFGVSLEGLADFGASAASVLSRPHHFSGGTPVYSDRCEYQHARRRWYGIRVSVNGDGASLVHQAPQTLMVHPARARSAPENGTKSNRTW